MESEERTIFHVDVNSAFLSWSALRRLEEDPGAVDLREIPSAVGGDIRTRHGVITAKSIPAKKYGVQTVSVLTGFKYIGEQIAILEAAGHPERFIFGFE